jgi:cobalt-zinc-cadmium efflux system membrane fusion protein
VPLAAIVYEGDRTHVWVARQDGAVEARDIKLGVINGDNAQVVDGLHAGEQIVTRGALFIDRAATGDKAS